ncbi:hypothetical protein PPGU19_096840 (plasmid) [Paraburkholderia sp. PGU19]|uniref:YncE family protein n=1 Tax=Paraburkholderia sp. PGU19 TaxID=2735434 RepID=UPI0015DAC91A|nr:hypothetical protein [Paraburkholderia sp. PGU19]BCG05116.1 hypothetical protein PPGU19_096840 [Paraburkholderia sp. PGU19]
MRVRIPKFSLMALACATLLGNHCGAVAATEPATAAASAVLQLRGHTELPEYSGDFDHLAADVKGDRLFLAGEDQSTLEVFDLKTGTHLKTIKGFEQPHGVLYLPDVDRIIVTDSGPGMTRVLDASNYRIIGSIPLTVGADSMYYDPSSQHLYIVTGGKNANPKMSQTIVAEVDPRTGRRVGEMTFDTDFTESMVAEQKGRRLFINLTGKSTMAVVDKVDRRVIDNWQIKGGEMNAAMAFDEVHQRLFVSTRKPFKLLVLDARNGTTVASFDAPERTNQVMFDKMNHRVYMAGDDYLGVIQQKDANHYEELPRVKTAKGAKTALLVPELHQLYVAVSPGENKVGGALLRFNVPSNGATHSLAGD